MSVIELEFTSRGGNTTLGELRRIQAAINSTVQGTQALARSLNVSFRQAQQFARGLGISTDRANQAIAIIRDLRQTNANLAVQYREVSRRVGLTRNQFIQLNAQLNRSRQLTTAALGAIALTSQQTSASIFNAGRNAVQVFTTLEAAINQFQAISGESQAAVARVQQVVEELGSTTSKTAIEVAQTSVVLARLGFTGEQVANILPAISRGSIATTESSEILATVLGNVTTQFQESNASQTRFLEINDALVNTANSSATNVAELGEALGFVGSTANNAGQDIETTLAILGLFAQAGIRSTRAGTSLSNVFTRLRNAAAGVEDPSNKASRALARLGVTITDSRGQLLNFGDTLPQILDALRQIENVGERGILLEDIFGLRQARDFNALLNLNNEQIDAFVENIQRSSGAAQRSADVILQGLSGSVTELNSALEGLSAQSGESIAVLLKPLVDGAVLLVRTFTGLPAPIRNFVLTITGLTATLGAAIAVVSGLTAANRLLQFSETASTIATLASNTARKTGTLITTAHTLAQTRLNIALTLQRGITLRIVAAEGARAAATSSATAATSASTLALAGFAGVLAGTAASITAAIATYNDITKAQKETDSATRELSEALADLDQVLLGNIDNAEEAKEAISAIADQNLELLKDDLSFISRLLDFIRRPLPGLTAAEAAANRQSNAFSNQLIEIDKIISRYDALRTEVITNGNITQEAVDAQIVALDLARSKLQEERPVTQAAVVARQTYLDTIERSISELNNFGKATEQVTQLQQDNTESIENQAVALRELRQTLEQEFQDSQIEVRQREEDDQTLRERSQSRVIENIKDIGQRDRQSDQLAFEDRIENVKRQNEDIRRNRELELQNELEEIKKRGQEELQQLENQFTSEQETRESEFEEKLARDRQRLESRFDTEIDSTRTEIDRRIQIENARNFIEKRRLRRQFEAEDEAAKERARLEERLLDPILKKRERARERLNKREEEFELEQEQRALDFETNTLNPLRVQLEQELANQRLANERVLNQFKFNAEDQIISLRRNFEQEQADFKAATEQRIIELRRNFEDRERDRTRSFAREQQQIRSQFEANLRTLNLQNAQNIRDTFINVPAPNNTAIPSFRDGGFADAGLAIVGENGAELVNFNRPAFIHNSEQTREILADLNFSRPNINTSTSVTNNSTSVNTRFNKQLIGTLQRIESKITARDVTVNNQFNNSYQKDNPNELLRRQRSELTNVVNNVVLDLKFKH